MAEYIEREAALNSLCQENCGHDFAEGKCHNCYTSSFITYLPAADVAPVVHAKWIHKGQRVHLGVNWWGCSVCGDESGAQWMRYCPNCGARMDGE